MLEFARATTSGLRVNTRLEVLDERDEPLGRLCAVGKMQGDMFAVEYPMVFPGLSHGRCGRPSAAWSGCNRQGGTLFDYD